MSKGAIQVARTMSKGRERVGRSAQVYIIYELGVVLKCELNLSELNDSLNY